MDKTTMDPLLHPLMDLQNITPGYCVICKRTYPTEKHHIVPRSAGELYRDGKKLKKPVIELCGFGNNLNGSDGKPYCHGLAHSRMLHFRANEGRLEYLKTDHPTKYQDALEMDGWQTV